MPKFNLLTEPHGNPKTRKAGAANYLNYILHLSPANVSGHETCQWRTKGCTALCLNLAGHGGVFARGATSNRVQDARKRKTRLFFEHREEFLCLLVADIEKSLEYAARMGMTAAYRLNGTSDIVWESIPVTRDGNRYENIFAAFADVQFYDYTKAPYDARRHDIPNYHLTFSWAETRKNQTEALKYYRAGNSFSVVFGRAKNVQLPEFFQDIPVHDGDISDLRFLDKHGVIGLHAKGNAWKHSPNGFIN